MIADFKNKTASHRRRLRLWPGVRPHWRQAGHEPGAWPMYSKTHWTKPWPRCKRPAPSAGHARGRVQARTRWRPWAQLLQRFGAPHFVFNNAGVGIRRSGLGKHRADWDWVLGVNLMGVVHGVRVFTPMMLAAAKADPPTRATSSTPPAWPGWLNAPNMGVYNVSKHAVVSLSETLYQDLALVTDQISASVLCPYFVPTGISQSHRNRPEDLKAEAPNLPAKPADWPGHE
jgi:NAD(P)-dependent dehydrogenase (short-subunit alcohol dehydrogenase family)